MTSSGNLYRDFNRPNPDLRLARATLAAEIIKSLDARSLSTRDAAAKTGIAHSEFSRIRNLNLTRFTLDRLFRILNRLDPDKVVVVEVRDAEMPASA